MLMNLWEIYDTVADLSNVVSVLTDCILYTDLFTPVADVGL